MKNKKAIKQLISKVAYNKHIEDHEGEGVKRLIQCKPAKETYQCKHKVFVNKSMRSDLKLLTEVLKNPDKYRLETSISHIIEREPDFINYGDACFSTAGGFRKTNLGDTLNGLIISNN